MPVGPHQLFDYTFLTRSPCCNPGGGSFENGNSTEAGIQIDAYVIALSANQIGSEGNMANQSKNWSASN